MSPDGLAVLDKSAGLTSHDVVARARKVLGTRKVGHAGTLDPMATGVLVLGVGSATKLLTYLVGVDKTYLATIRLGGATTTDDAEGEPLQRHDTGSVTPQAIAEGVARLTGPIQQVPSSVSAIKVNGQRAYARVRAGEDVTLNARPVTIHRFDVLAMREQVDVGDGGPTAFDLDVAVACSSGTYIRALARDLGADLGVGGHLTQLRRSRVGPFTLAQAQPWEQFAEEPKLLTPAQAASAILQVQQVSQAQVEALRHGRRIAVAGIGSDPRAALSPDGDLVAIVIGDGQECRPILVMS